MSTETLTLNIPTSLVQELSRASQAFLVNILERGLHDFKIEQALNQPCSYCRSVSFREKFTTVHSRQSWVFSSAEIAPVQPLSD
jgi:hypothetical protein